MKQNILQVAVTAAPETTEDALSAGKMYEHNATAICFTLNEALVLPEYRYYVEFVTVSGTARTAYLTPDENRQITVDLPVEVTSQMTALCIFNIVQIAENGKTEQVIKAKTVRLYFSALENTDRLIDENHAFSVNQLLESIRQNTFKGDKGDKGDAYILTDADKTEIAQRVDQAFYGLPMQKYMTVCGARALSGASDNASVHALTVRPVLPMLSGLASVQVAIGKNLLADILDSSLYNTFTDRTGNYVTIQFTAKPGVQYIFGKLTKTMALYTHAYLTIDGQNKWFCHKTAENSNRNNFVFTVPESGAFSLCTTQIYVSQNAYQNVLDTDWVGITVMEEENSILLQKTFDEPLYAVSEAIGDSYDFISGTLTRRTAKTTLTAAQLLTENTVQLGDAAYRYTLTLPDGVPTRQFGCSAGLCSVLPTMSSDITTADAYATYCTQSGQSEGIWLGSHDSNIYIVSTKDADTFSAWLDEQTVELLYAAAERTETGESMTLQLPVSDRDICVSPNQLCAEIRFSADISSVTNDLESRLSALENKIE
ncbi:MAG: hypothetical protein ACI4K9_06440 [Candidatus Fimenecus sp.]